MKDKILAIIYKALEIDGTVRRATGVVSALASIEIAVPEAAAFGHYSTNVAMRLAKAAGEKPLDFAVKLTERISAAAPAGFFEKVEAVTPGFINFWLSKETIGQEFVRAAADAEAGRYGRNENMAGKTVMVEYTDPNPFKLFHIGHLMSNAIGESFARLYEAAGATVRRANYYGDVGLHIAKSVWGMEQLAAEMPNEKATPVQRIDFLGKAYAYGSRAYEEKPEAKEEIITINKKIYELRDENGQLNNHDGSEVGKLYIAGLAWSLTYFQAIYDRLGTKFDDFFPESSISGEGIVLVRARKDIFPESDGAIIFPGEQYGLHTRVFINSQGLPTYEAKELGLNKKKFELHHLDLSIVVTGNEIRDYFKVLMKAMELTLPEVAAKTHHVPHGMLRLPTGKMSSRTGDVITADALLEQIKLQLCERISEKSSLDVAAREEISETVAIGAIKYSILRQNPGQDIIFDFEKSLSFEGDSGPYLQYAYARLKSILRKAEERGQKTEGGGTEMLDSEIELALMRKILEFPDVVARAGATYAPSLLATYLHRLASTVNKFYETTPILKDDNQERLAARLVLAATAAKVLRVGLGLLGIKTLEKI